jgi:mannose-1-phosphate guanylyltransferase
MGAHQNKKLHVLILAGGSGTRFWPSSRKDKPKQFLSLWDDKTLLEHTLDRVLNSKKLNLSEERIWIGTTSKLEKRTQEILEKRNKSTKIKLLLEPTGKNTAPCIYWALQEVQKIDSNSIMLVIPADHFIKNEDLFIDAVAKGVEFISKNPSLMTLGIQPVSPETGYGYIEKGLEHSDKEFYKVSKFIEKPSFEKAQTLLESKKFLWNAGIFLLDVSFALDVFSKTMPSLVNKFSENKPIEKVYASLDSKESTSIDYGVLEKCEALAVPLYVLPVSCGWSDVGSFTALKDFKKSAKTIELLSNNNIVKSDAGTVVLYGVKDLVVVRDGDVFFVMHQSKAQEMKELLNEVEKKDSTLL